MKKLRNNRGETLLEVMASIVIATLSVALLFSCIMASTKVDMKAEDIDASHYAALSEADGRGGEPELGTVTITRKGSSDEATPTVQIYGDSDGLFSYKGK